MVAEHKSQLYRVAVGRHHEVQVTRGLGLDDSVDIPGAFCILGAVVVGIEFVFR